LRQILRSPKAIDMTQDELRKIPKVELHRHLECSIRFSTLKELATLSGMQLPKSEREIKEKLLVTKPMGDLNSVLEKFLVTQTVLSSEEVLTRITFEAIEDAAQEGIRILELRWAPTFIQQGHENLSFEQMHLAILKGVDQAKHLPVAVGLLVLIQRTLPLSFAKQVTDFAIAHKGAILGLDLADNEVGFEPRPFAPHFERARKAGLHVTVHSGEADVPGAADFVRDAIELLGAQRIGHGVQVYKSPEMIEFLRARKVPLELCPTSNWLTNAVSSTAAHPFRKLMEDGVLVTLNSDDPGVFDIDLVNEYRVLATEHNFTNAEFDHINNIAASASFIPFELKQKHWPRPIDRTLAPLSN
jgi:adenosine deaminase